MQHEYYVRQPGDPEARGPFTFEQLSSLARAGGLDANTLYFDANSEQWAPVASSAELGGLLPRDVPAPAPAEGRATSRRAAATHDAGVAAVAPAGAGNPRAFAGARVLLFASALVLLVFAFATAWRDGAGAGGWGMMGALLSLPFFWLGVADVLLGALAGPIFAGRMALAVRLRAALGLGFFAVFFWLEEAAAALVFAAVASACLWLATVFEGRGALWIVTITGLAALAGFAYCTVWF